MGTPTKNATRERPSQVGIADIVVTPDGLGYWLVDKVGRVFNFGNAPFLGDLTSQPPPIGGVSLDPASTSDSSGTSASRAAAIVAALVAMGAIAGWSIVGRREAHASV